MLSRVGLLVAVSLCLAIPQVAQQFPNQHRSFADSLDTGPAAVADPVSLSPQAQRMQRQEQIEQAQRQLRQLHEETDQLAVLAGQLKADVDKAGSQALSVGAMKKAQEIEKLAKKIRSNMKGL